MVHPWTEFPVRQCFPYHLLVRLLHDKKLLRLHRGRLYPTLRRFPPIARVTRLGAMEHCRCGEATCSGLWTDDENQRKKHVAVVCCSRPGASFEQQHQTPVWCVKKLLKRVLTKWGSRSCGGREQGAKSCPPGSLLLLPSSTYCYHYYYYCYYYSMSFLP